MGTSSGWAAVCAGALACSACGSGSPSSAGAGVADAGGDTSVLLALDAEGAGDSARDTGTPDATGDVIDAANEVIDATNDANPDGASTSCGTGTCSADQACVTNIGGPAPPDGSSPGSNAFSSAGGQCVAWPAGCADPHDCTCVALCGSQSGSGIECFHNSDSSFTCAFP